MNAFERIFGIRENAVKKNCIIMPLVNKTVLRSLKLDQLHHGKLYSTGVSDSYTLIKTGIGPAFVGDAVLYLENTACENIFLFGSCGLIDDSKKLSIGDLVSPHICYSFESFSDILLTQNQSINASLPDKKLFSLLSALSSNQKPVQVACASCGSLKLEHSYSILFQDLGIDIVDMECSAFFAAAKFINRAALALFFINDIITKKPFYQKFDQEDKNKLSFGISRGISLLLDDLINNL